jgi:SET domain-containing protein
MLSELNLRILDSNIPHAGKGLFAVLPGNAGMDELVFEPGDLITEYTGERVTFAEMNKRYTARKTAPYAANVPSHGVDAACERGVASLANHAPESRKNGKFVYDSRNNLYLVATKNIYNGEEILVNYGTDYRLRERGASHNTRRGKRSRKEYARR